MKLRIALLLLTSSVVGLCDGLPMGSYIYTVGTAKVSAEPDLIYVDAMVSDVNMDQSIARGKVISETAQVFAVIAEAGVTQQDVTSHEVSIDTEYEYEDRKRVFKGYRVSQKIRIVARDAGRLATLTAKLAGGLVSKVEVEKTDTTKRDEIERALLNEAIKDARRRAEAIAQSIGVSIESVYAVSPVAFGDVRSSFLGGDQTGGARGFGSISDRSGGPIFDIRLPKIQLEESVNVIFSVRKP